MKIVYHKDFNESYTLDPAAAEGRIEAIVKELTGKFEFIEPAPAPEDSILAVHTPEHIASVKKKALYDIAALAAGGAILAAETALQEPSFALIRPPGHHASADSSWGFCYFNNMAVAIEHMKCEQKIEKAFILDFDLHYGDGNVAILGQKEYITILNPKATRRDQYLLEVEEALAVSSADMFAVSAGFDNHEDDWGGLLHRDDYRKMGKMIRQAAERNNGSCFGILEGGYNHAVLGHNVLAFIEGLQDA